MHFRNLWRITALFALAGGLAGCDEFPQLTWPKTSEAEAPKPYVIPPLPVGRYQIVFNPNVREDTFLVDTVTGRVWSPIEYSNLAGNPTAWQEMPRFETEQDEADFVRAKSQKPKPAPVLQRR